MKFDIDLIHARIATERDRIARDFAIRNPSARPFDFCAQVVAALNQPTVPHPLEQTIDDTKLFEAACLAIWSSATDWAVVVQRRDKLSNAFLGFDPAGTHRAFLRGDLTIDHVVDILHTQYARNGQAPAMRAWSERLVRMPDHYCEVIARIGYQIRQIASSRTGLTNSEMMISLAVYFSGVGPSRWPGEAALAEAGYRLPALADRKFQGMGFPISCEFFRNLGWSGFKPDVHITRLFNHWSQSDGLPLADFRPRAMELADLAGRGRNSEMILHAQYSLAGITLTPADVAVSEADNLIWLLGKYIERPRRETDLKYLIPD
nr:hypothetical protein [Mycolicibacterium malmesburyense]CRL67738.1 hypothetical protein CPGR_00568 [Mycolicibacterium malmesburyense]